MTKQTLTQQELDIAYKIDLAMQAILCGEKPQIEMHAHDATNCYLGALGDIVFTAPMALDGSMATTEPTEAEFLVTSQIAFLKQLDPNIDLERYCVKLRQFY